MCRPAHYQCYIDQHETASALKTQRFRTNLETFRTQSGETFLKSARHQVAGSNLYQRKMEECVLLDTVSLDNSSVRNQISRER